MLTHDSSLRVTSGARSRMVVDGKRTKARWPGKAPFAHRVGGAARYLLYDGYDANRIWLWDRETRKLTELGRGSLFPVARAGMLVGIMDDDRLVYHDVHPEKPELRPLWTEPPANQRIMTWVVGSTTSGAPAIVSRTTTGTRLLKLNGPGEIATTRIAMDPRATPASDDALRGSRLLLTTEQPRTTPEGVHGTIKVRVTILDVETDRARDVGFADGCWTKKKGGIYPYFDVTWKDHDPRVPRPGREPDCPVLVDPVKEKL